MAKIMVENTNKPQWLRMHPVLMFAAILAALACGRTACAQSPAQINALSRMGQVRPKLTPANGVQATTVPLALPAGIAFDQAGNLYIADLNDNVIHKVDLAGIITTVAGTGEQGYSGDGAAATSALLDSPAGVAIDASGDLYIADTHNHRIRKVSGGTITTLAGMGTAGFSGDGGAAASALLSGPTALAVDATGNLYIADTDNHRIRKIAFGSGGAMISTVAGDGEQFFSGDGAAAIGAGLDSPNGVAVDAAGNIYIGDTHNQRVRVVNAAGTISTLAGNGAKTFAGDGGVATSASLARPRGLSVDASGNIYVADSDNNRIRVIAQTGTIKTLAGNGSQGFAGDGGPAVNAVLDTPRATAVTAGVVAFSDTNNHRIREVGQDANINTIAGLSPTAGGSSLGESLTLAGASTVSYGSGQLITTFSNGGLTATGQVSLLDITGGGSAAIGSATLSGNTATISVAALPAGLHRIVASYGGDVQNAAVVSGVFLLTVSPLPLTANATAVSLQYGQPVPPVTGTLNGVLSQDTANVTGVFFTSATATSVVGVYPITVTLAGSAAGNYTVALAPGSGNVTIGQAASTITLTSSNVAPSLGAPVTLTAQVASTTTGRPTGSVAFYDGTNVLNTAAVGSTGLVSYTTNVLAVGAHSITAVYSGDTNFTGTSSAVTVETVGASPDFTMTPTGGASQTVNPGQTATYNFTLQSQSVPFTSPITLTASGLPPGATATFTPATIAPGNTTNTFALSIQTAALTSTNKPPAGPLRTPLFPISAALLVLPVMRSKRFRAGLSKMPRMVFSALLLLLGGAALLGMTGCGSGGFFGQNPKTYTITVTAATTSGIGTTVQHASQVTLTVE